MPRVGLTRETVLAAALALADADGLDKLSMRRLAAELDVEAMSLYNHVKDKRDLLGGLMDLVWAEVDLAADESDMRAALHRMCGSSYRAMLAHPWFFQLPASYGGLGRLAVLDAMLGHLHRGGVPASAAFHAQHVIDGFVYGYAWQDAGFDMADMQARADEMLAAIDADAMPHLMEHARLHFEDTPPGDGFAIGLDMLIDGLDTGKGGDAT